MKCLRTEATWCGATFAWSPMPCVGEDGEEAAPVRLAVLPADQAAVLHPGDLVGETALGLQGGGGEVAHPHPAVVGLREVDQDLVVVHGQAERLKVLLELVRRAAC